MTLRTSLLRTAAFTLLYAAATYAGRLTVLDNSNLSLVWPAAGVSAFWFWQQYASRWRLADVVALAGVTVTVNAATGAPLSLTGWFVAANLVQAMLFARLTRRWLPRQAADGAAGPLARVTDLYRLLGIALICTGCGALLGPTGVWLASGSYSWAATAVWLTRNTVSIMLIGAASIRLTGVARTSLAKTRRAWSASPGRRRLEYLALAAVSAVGYGLVFGVNHHLPLAFTVIALTVWAGTRLHTTFVLLHDLVFGSVAVLFTLHGDGVFATIGSLPVRALIAQAFVGMIAVVGLSLALGRDERVALLADLQEAQAATGRQATMMTAIVDSMAEGLTVVDDQGRFLLRNPAVGRLVGGVVSTTGQMARPEFYGLFHPDGRPLAPEEMPYRRALDSGDVRGMDVLVRNPGLPQGRILSVSATALPDDGNGHRYAVSVFHDVTAERRHRTELAAFAGAVAHDLLNPLATIEGWTETLIEQPADPETAGTAERISRAATRMRNMINDLLAYTTARDATLSPTHVDLGVLVNDIAVARIDQAHSCAAPLPTFTVGELHDIYADPVLVRQLLENLISNAIKYTAPGVTPDITIATERQDQRIAVTISDNGIGIPAGQHAVVFDDFQRAHRAAGYTGTGLGLGICKRIVERHGGTITATDNPTGHGTRFVFTLPADASTLPTPAPSPGPAETDLQRPPVVAVASTSDGAAAEPAVAFEHAAHLVLEYLHEQMPLAFWAVTRVENGRQTYLYLDADNGYGLRQGDSHPWQDSYCIHMTAGTAPGVALDARTVPAYAAAAINDSIDIATYAGAPITEPDGSLFGAICGLDPATHTDDPRMAGAEPLLVLLGRLLTAALATDRAQHRSAGALLREQLSGDTDTLTGLPNRRAWQRLIDHVEQQFARLADPTVIAMLDLDGLKAINDSQGHAAGDTYLQTAATAARQALRDSDTIARLGGDEFAILLRDCTEDHARAVITRIHAHLHDAGVEASIGWASVNPADGFTAATQRADEHMYAIKRRRRHRRAAEHSA